MAASPPILFVAGLGRCGTTMVMTMLDRGGFPFAAAAPDYETDEMSPGRVDRAWVRGQAGKAVKWIAPDLAPIRPSDLQGIPAVTVVLRRCLAEQAASQIKMAGEIDDRRSRRAMTAHLIKSWPKMVAMVARLGPVYYLDFENIIADPQGAASHLEELVFDHFDMDFRSDLAAQVPIRRSPKCAPDLSFEIGLIRGAQ